MPNVYEYLNYREYLSEFVREKKQLHPGFSYQLMADRAGFKSKSFIKLVIDGKKNLSESSIIRLNNVLKLRDRALAYFSDLVAFNQTRSKKVQNALFEKLSVAYGKKNAVLVSRQKYEFYSKWYHNSVRELVTWFPFDNDYEKLGKMLQPSIPARSAQESVELLMSLGMIRRKGRVYEQSDPLISTGDEVTSLAVHNFHLQNLEVTGEALESCPACERDVSGLIVGLSEEGFDRFKKEIQDFRKRLLMIAEGDCSPSRVYHVNFQFFPTTRKCDVERLS